MMLDKRNNNSFVTITKLSSVLICAHPPALWSKASTLDCITSLQCTPLKHASLLLLYGVECTFHAIMALLYVLSPLAQFYTFENSKILFWEQLRMYNKNENCRKFQNALVHLCDRSWVYIIQWLMINSMYL